MALRDVVKEESIRLEVFTGWEAKVGGTSGGVRLLRIQEGPGGHRAQEGRGPGAHDAERGEGPEASPLPFNSSGPGRGERGCRGR